MISNIFYELPQKSWWQGRVDGDDPLEKRWHEEVQIIELNALRQVENRKPVIFLGYACDEGVARNHGRTGAVIGPVYLRKSCSNLPRHFSDGISLLDVGNIACIGGKLEQAQQYLSKAVSMSLGVGGFPVLLGGGHDIVFGHYMGIREQFADKKIGIINFDAHFDLRQPTAIGGTSGTGFYQIAAECQDNGQSFDYLAIGIQKSANTPLLFNTAGDFGVAYILAEELMIHLSAAKEQLMQFLDKVDKVYLTIDLDVFNGSIAPGVSAPAAVGLFYSTGVRSLLHHCFSSGKVVSMDIAELNPTYDIDDRTARLGAQIIFDAITEMETSLSVDGAPRPEFI